jgi:intracellular multiplication protein IcmE
MAENSGRNRLFLMIGLAVVVVVGGFLLFRSSTKQAPAKIQETVAVASAPDIDPVPGGSSDPDYSATVVMDNERRAQQAQQEQRTTLPTLVNPQSGGSVFPEVQVPVEPKPLPEAAPPVAVPPPSLPGRQAPGRAQRPARAPEEQQRSVASMEEKIKAMQEQWQPKAAYQEFAYVAVVPEELPDAPASDPDRAGANDLDEEPEEARALILAGSIVPAVLLGPVNSDNPGPVLAQIVAGPLRGARVLGTFKQRRKHVVLEFSTLSWPQTGRSMRISAYGVNEDASLGMATDVNNHYFLRYGLTLAAAFVEGYGSASSRENTTIIVSPNGLPIEQRGELTSEQVRRSALGNVGQTLRQQLQQEANIPPTITVDAQAPIGLLFMADF